LQSLQRLQRGPHPQLNLPSVRAAREELAGHGLGLLIDIARDKLAIVRKALGHHQCGIACEGTQFEHAPRPGQLHQQTQKRSFQSAHLHLRHAHLFIRLFPEFLEEGIRRLGVGLRVLFNLRWDKGERGGHEARLSGVGGSCDGGQRA
jgi:hypothetical protein